MGSAVTAYRYDRAGSAFEFGGEARGDLEKPTKPRRPQTRRISQCMQRWLSRHYFGFDWNLPTISSDAPLPYMGASTNSDLMIFVGHKQYSSFERNSWLFFHEIAHMPQWASGDLTTLGYVGSAAKHFFRHDDIPVEIEANSVRDFLRATYNDEGRPCD